MFTPWQWSLPQVFILIRLGFIKRVLLYFYTIRIVLMLWSFILALLPTYFPFIISLICEINPFSTPLYLPDGFIASLVNSEFRIHLMDVFYFWYSQFTYIHPSVLHAACNIPLDELAPTPPPVNPAPQEPQRFFIQNHDYHPVPIINPLVIPGAWVPIRNNYLFYPMLLDIYLYNDGTVHPHLPINDPIRGLHQGHDLLNIVNRPRPEGNLPHPHVNPNQFFRPWEEGRPQS